MSTFNFNEFLPKIVTLANSFTNSAKDDLKAMFQSFDALEEELQNAKARARDKVQKDKSSVTGLQRINEDDIDSPKVPEDKAPQASDNERTSSDSGERRGSKKRSKHEVEGMESPEVEKRQKRNASVKAQSIITKQVNVNLTQKLRRENSTEKGRRRRGKEDDKENTEPVPLVQVKQEKISVPPEPEPEPMEIISSEPMIASIKQEPTTDVLAMPPPVAPVPKPRRGVPKEKSEESDEEAPRQSSRGRRTKKQTDTMPAQPVTSQRSTRSTRASSRATKQTEGEEPQPEAETRPKRTRAKKVAETANPEAEKESSPPVENIPASPAEVPRPKRTRRVQKAAEKESEKISEQTQAIPPPQPDLLSPKDERISRPEAETVNLPSPVIHLNTTKLVKTKTQDNKNNTTTNVIKNLNNNNDMTDVNKIHDENHENKTDEKIRDVETKNGFQKTKNLNRNHENAKIDENGKEVEINGKVDSKRNKNKNDVQETKDMNGKNKVNSNMKEISSNNEKTKVTEKVSQVDVTDKMELDKTRVLSALDATVTISKDPDQTVVLHNGVYNHDPVTPQAVRAMNETVVLEQRRETVVLEKQAPMNATVVLDKGNAMPTNMTADDSLLTDDSDSVEATPPKKPPAVQPTSAVKEKVQQFEEMASRVTRTKTRAMAKKEEQTEEQTPPDKVSKAVLSSETLAKMNTMIFNGKPPVVSKSASKPCAIPTPATKGSLVTGSASKLSGVNRAREADELRREREDARKKKEALLEAKREMQRKKREEKMAAAAAAREAAERERRAAMEAAARERMEKQHNADLGKLERLKEVERKKLETARKVAETEERRKAEERARQQRLADEQRRAEAARRKQLEEAEALKKEEALMQREIERRQKEFMEKQRMKQRMEGDKISTPHKAGQSPRAALEPVYMQDGFQYLNSDDEDDDDAPDVPSPPWAASKVRRRQLTMQERIPSALVDKLFSVRAHTPDLREIFPEIERARLKRTSSAVWRTPPGTRLPVVRE